ncbi:MAG: hypothetical protein ACT4QD_13565 [Acidobacteriota bacterium]
MALKLRPGEIVRAALRSVSDPAPTRLLLLKALDAVFNFLSFEAKIRVRSVPKAPYGFGLLHSARLAARLGVPRISALEFGVAGGNGLVALEDHARYVTRETGVEIAIYGLDSGAGLPPPVDYRDMPYAWEKGFYAMDLPKLQARLTRATLVIGDVRETTRRFGEADPAPIGFIAFDLDYYSSTVAALEILDIGHRFFLPRVFCYFDDVAGGPNFCYSEFTGELLAIREFNASHSDRKIAQLAGLRHNLGSLPTLWHEKMYVAHHFTHPQYNVPTHRGEDSLALR